MESSHEASGQNIEMSPIPPKTDARLPTQLVIDQFERIRSKQITTNFKNLLSALALFEYIFNDDKSKENQIVVNLKFEIDENFTELSPSQLYYLGVKCEHKAVVVAISSKDQEKISIYWKSKELGHFLMFKPYNGMILRDYKELYDFITKFLVSSLRNGHLGVFNQLFIHHEMRAIELHFLADSRNYNLLLLAAESGNPLVVKNLLGFNLNPNSLNEDINAQFLAYKNRHFSVLLNLLEANFPYPNSMDISHSSMEIKIFLSKSCALHKMITDGNEEKVVEILTQNPKIRHFFNFKNESAATIALRSKSLEMYKILLSHGVSFGTNENPQGTITNLCENMQENLQKIHENFSKIVLEKHICVLLANSSVGQDDEQRLELLQSAFITLNNIPLIEIILKIIAASKNFQIIFDFTKVSVSVVDPSSDLPYKCILYSSNIIYINIWQILNENTRNDGLGLLAHELCHYALNLVYDNFSKPYHVTDYLTREKFKNISQFCYANCNKEDVVKVIYQYPRHMHHAELIAAVPHLLGKYSNKPENLEEVRENFKPLFDIFEQKIFMEMESALVMIESSERQQNFVRNEYRKYWIRFSIGLGIISVISFIVLLVYLFV